MKYKKYIPYALIGLLIWGSFWISPKPQNLGGAVVSAQTDNGLVGYWSFEDATGTQATDFSGKGNTGTLTNMADPPTSVSSWTSGGKRGAAINFDGSNDYVQISSTSTMNLNASGTVSIWFNGLAGTFGNSTAILFSTLNWDTDRNGFYLAARTNIALSWELGSSSTAQSAAVGGALNPGTWYHAALTWDGSNVKTYLDGVEIDSRAQTVTPDTTVYPLRIGENASGSSRAFPGALDDARVYNRTLSGTEITALYNTGAAKAKTANNLGLIGYWSMEDGTGTQATDFSGGGSAGTLTGNAVSWVNGKRGKGLSFGGSDDYVNMGNVLDFERTDTRSFAFWINVAAAPSAHNIFASKIGDASAYRGFDIGVRGDVAGDPLEFELRGSADSNWLTIRATPPAWDGNWHHVVMTYSGNSAPSGVKIYFDGTLLSNTTDADTLASSIGNTGSFVLGAFDETLLSADFTGSLDEFRIYNRVLTQAEVTALYNSGSVRVNAPNNNGLVGYWSMEDATGTQATDFSGQGNTGTLNGGASWINGKRGKALTFDGSTSYIDVINNSSTRLTSNWTYSIWARRNSSGVLDPLFSNFLNNTAGRQIFIYYTTSPNNHLQIDVPWISAILTSSAAITNTDWHLLTFTKSGILWSIYIDGVLDNSIEDGTAQEASTATNMQIGSQISYSGYSHFAGSLDEVRVYNRALSATEVSDLYNTGR